MVLGTDQMPTLTQTAARLLNVINGFWLSVLIHISLGTFAFFLLVILAMSLKPESTHKIYLPESEEERAMRKEREKKMQGPNGVYLG